MKTSRIKTFIKKASLERIMQGGKPEWVWKKCPSMAFHIFCSQSEQPHLRLMRHRLDKEGGRHLFSIPHQDVNNVPPSKRSLRENNHFISHTQHFLLIARMNKALQRKVAVILGRITLRTTSY